MAKAAANKDQSLTKVTIGLIRFSFVHVWEATRMNNDPKNKAKYSVSILIPKSDTALVDKVNKAIAAALEEGKTGKLKGKNLNTIKMPLRDGDKERSDKNEEYKGMWFLNASSDTQPGIVDASRNDILQQSDFYSGCYGRAIVNFYAFATGTGGVAAGLNHVQKIKDGPALAGRGDAADEFDDGFEEDLTA